MTLLFSTLLQSEKKKRDRIEKEREQEVRDKDEEIMNLKERMKRTEIELKVALERYEDLKNQDTRSRGFLVILFNYIHDLVLTSYF